MERREPEQVDKVADVLYAISRFIVVVCILPIAIWFATFTLLETIISDFFVRVLVSSAFGIGLFGLLLILTSRLHVGAIMVDLSILTSAVSLSILWNTTHSTIACIHGYFVTTLLVLFYLKRKDAISKTMWKRLIIACGLFTLITGPIAISTTLLFYSVPMSIVLTIFPLSLVLYLMVIHLGTKGPRIGVIHSILLGITSGLLSSHVFVTSVGFLDMLLNISVFLFGFGIGILVSSQVERELDRILNERKSRKVWNPTSAEFEEPENITQSNEHWIVNYDTAHVLSGIGVTFISIGSSPIFLWLARSTALGLIPEFETLFIPFTILLSLLILAPSPVFFRLGRKINRDTESTVVRGIGLMIVILVAITSFTWTQYNQWNFYYSLTFTLFIFVMGITGLFRRIRRLWRNLWLRIVRVFRTIKSWVITHPLQTGVTIDLIVSSLCIYAIFPILILLPDSILSVSLAFVAVFSLIGTLGLVGLKKLPRRNQFLATSWTIFLCTISSFVFWTLIRVWSLDLVSSVTIALQPLLLSILLLKTQIPRSRVSILYFPAVLSFAYQIRMFELQFTILNFPLFTILSLVVLLAPILYLEYTRLFAALLRVILISSAVLICCILFLVEIYILIPVLNLDVITSLILILVMFFAAYLPVPRKYETEGASLLRTTILGLALSLSLLIFIYTATYHIVFRLLVSLFAIFFILLLSRNTWPEKYRPYIIITTWCLALALGSFLLFELLVNYFDVWISFLSSGFIFSIGLLPLQRIEVINTKASIAYLILAIPFGTTLVYFLSFNPVYALFVAILLPIPVAYQHYNRFIRWLGGATRNGIRLFLLFVAINIIISLGIIGITLSYIISQFLSPYFASYPIPIIPVALTFILIALVIWSPAFYIRRTERPAAIPIIITVLSVVLSLTAVTLIQHSDWILSLTLVILISTTIVTLCRNSFPEHIQQYFIPVTWCSILATLARFGFLNYVAQFGEIVTTLICLVLIGIGLLPLKLTKIPLKLVNTLYGLFTFPAALLLAFIVNQGLLITILTIIIVPIPVAYKQYLQGLKAFVRALEYGMQLALVQIALHLVIVIGFAAIILSGTLVYLLYPFFQLYPISALPSVLSFVTILLLIWLPAFALNTEENLKPISIGLTVLCATLSVNIIYLIQSSDLILSVLGALFIFGSLMTFANGKITYLESSKLPAITAVGSLVLTGIYLVPVDIFTKCLLIVLSSSLFSVLFMNEANKGQIAYPLITGSFFGIVFWQFFLANYDVLLLIIGYVCIETLFLSYVGNLRKYSWCIFATTLGIVISIILQPLGITGILIGILIGFEVFWRVPEVPELEAIFERYSIHHGNVQSFLLASITALLVNQGINDLVVVGESFLLVLLTSLMFANRKTASVQLEYAMSFAVTLTLSALVFEFITMFYPLTTILVVYPSLIIIAMFLLWSSGQEPYRQYNWHLFSAIIAFLVSLVWYIFYGMFETVILVIPTFVTIFFLLELKIPESDWKSKSELIPAMSSSILLAEIIWVWHATIGFMLEPIVVLIGVGVLLLSTIFIPAFEAIDWFTFRRPWIIVSTFASFCLTGLFTGWNILSLQLPSSPLLLLGIGFIFYSLFTTPYFIKAEKSIQLEDSLSKYHQQWIPAIIGSIALGLQVGIQATIDVRVIFGLGLLGFSLAGIIYYFLIPERPSAIALRVNLSLATASGILYWVGTEQSVVPFSLLLYSALVWIIVSLPVTFGKIVSFVSICRRIISENKLEAAFSLPILLGLLTGIYISLTNQEIPFTDLILIWNISLILFPASLYFVGSHLLEEVVAMRLRKPTIALLGPGLLLSFLILTLTDNLLNGYSLILKISLSLVGTFLILFVVCKLLGLDYLKRIFYGITGLALAPSVYIFLQIILGDNLFYTIPGTILAILIFEAPLFSYQLKLLVKMLKDLGLLFRTLVAKFNSYMQFIFDRYGFIAWAIFSVAFVSVFGIISYPFFSELLNMPIAGFLYVVPSFGFPTMILGLLLLFIGIVRRKVKSRFGSVSGFLTVLGFGVSAFCGLYDNGYPYLAVAITVLSICLLALILRRELDVGDEYFVGAWVPIPLSVTAILLYYLYVPAATLEAQILAILLSLFPACCMYIASAYISWIPKTLVTPLWIALSLLSGTIAYLSSYLAFFPPLAAIYLSVFIASFVMYPVTGRKMIHLFFAPLFFALTGFAFTFLFGAFYQNLLLASASALFFVSRFVKEKRDERPELGYLAWLRLAILVALLIAVALFVVTVLFAANIAT
ncbi:MAG: hypothetical protein ACTSSE_12370 [Candidatus Thorarchaeota archaeon]